MIILIIIICGFISPGVNLLIQYTWVRVADIFNGWARNTSKKSSDMAIYWEIYPMISLNSVALDAY